MSAFEEIMTALKAAPPIPRGNKRFVIIGKEAMAAVRVDTVNHVEPEFIHSAAVVVTETFPGWEIVDRPDTLFSLAGKHRG